MWEEWHCQVAGGFEFGASPGDQGASSWAGGSGLHLCFSWEATGFGATGKRALLGPNSEREGRMVCGPKVRFFAAEKVWLLSPKSSADMEFQISQPTSVQIRESAWWNQSGPASFFH